MSGNVEEITFSDEEGEVVSAWECIADWQTAAQTCQQLSQDVSSFGILLSAAYLALGDLGSVLSFFEGASFTKMGDLTNDCANEANAAIQAVLQAGLHGGTAGDAGGSADAGGAADAGVAGGGGGGTLGCFTSRTMISANPRQIEISEIKPGMRLVNGATVLSPVKHEARDRGMLRLRLSNGRSLEVTRNHLIRSEGAWVPAGKLVVGRRLVPDTIEVTGIEEFLNFGEVYDMKTSDHTYFAEGVLVHNKEDVGPGTTTTPDPQMAGGDAGAYGGDDEE